MHQPKRIPPAPDRILSPFSILKRHRGNSFEYASLLTSFLIGAGLDAYVVFGFAARDLTVSLQSRTVCPDIPAPPKESEPEIDKINKKYKVNPGTDFRSQHLLKMEEQRQQRLRQQQMEEEESRQKAIDELEKPPFDELHGWRVHAWVVVLPPIGKKPLPVAQQVRNSSNSPTVKSKPSSAARLEVVNETASMISGDGNVQPEESEVSESSNLIGGSKSEEADKEIEDDYVANDNDDYVEMNDSDAAVQAIEDSDEDVAVAEAELAIELDEQPYYIEPATGRRYNTSHDGYLSVECVYNHKNYYVNLQEGRVPASFYLNDSVSWLPLLRLNDENSSDVRKFLDMPVSWVERLDIPPIDFERRYSSGEKVIRYKKAILEKYAIFSREDGLLKKISTFSDYEYQEPASRYEWYDKRFDNLTEIHSDYINKEVVEYFDKGREDYLKVHKYETGCQDGSIGCNRKLEFYHEAREDQLVSVIGTPDTLSEHYTDREDRLFLRTIEFGDQYDREGLHRNVISVLEKYNRNEDVPACDDVAEKLFAVESNEIKIVYHYESNCITNSTREFVKPKITEIGGLNFFTPELTSGYTANPNSKGDRRLQLYRMLCSLMEDEESTLRHVRHTEKWLKICLDGRPTEKSTPAKRLGLFDIDRNEAAKEGYAEMMAAEQEARVRELGADFQPGAPYAVRRASQAINLCLKDFKRSQLERQTKIQARYDKCTAELADQRQWYAVNQYTISPEADEKYQENNNQVLFEIGALEVQLERERALSSHRYVRLQQQLKADPAFQTTENRQ